MKQLRKSRNIVILKLWRWKWLGHVLRMSLDQNPKIASTWAPEGKRRRGRPRETWRRTIGKERENISDSRHGGRQRWRQKTELLWGDGLMAPFSTRREGKNDVEKSSAE